VSYDEGKYSTDAVRQWILGAFAVQRKHGDELQFQCPLCDHPSFYWNCKKQVGFCHRASCREVYGLDKMINEVGHPPDMYGHSAKSPAVKPAGEIKLPKEATQVERNEDAVIALATRGVTYDHIVQFQIHQEAKRLYVPIMEGGELRQYDGGRIDKSKAPKDWFDAGPNPYLYAHGHPVTHYFLGWDECKLWEDIVLVENTFVSMWLRDLHATATFGSHLSFTHIDKILHSRIKHVTFLWDEGTAFASEKAQRGLKAMGIDSRVIHIKGQPDDHTKEKIEWLLTT